ncbi:MAG TPA: SDR family oxidoreductase [Steroidobacteraceae bacterium]|jgi:NAD(P)-dependent dehydrogenase (short-subunit alcohol dehydrogenase family)
MSKLALITGANKGIGLETARQLGKLGFRVLLGARDAGAGARAAAGLVQQGVHADALTLDVTSPPSIARAAAEVTARFAVLDVLVNNAGVLLDDHAQPPSAQSLDVWHRTFEVNLFGTIAVTQAFLPLLRAAPAARIVNLSSRLASLTQHSDPSSPIYHSKDAAYNVSKTAVNAWTVNLAYELRDTPIKVNAAHPGHVKTDMGGASAPVELVDGARTSVALATLEADGPSGRFIYMDEELPW